MNRRAATMAFVRAWYHWSEGNERLSRMMLVVALSHAGCAGAAFTGELSSTSGVVDTSDSGQEADISDASAPDAPMPVPDAAADTYVPPEASPIEAAPPPTVCVLPSNVGAFYEVHADAGCSVDRTPADCLAANTYNCTCFRAFENEIATECDAGWSSCRIVDSGIVLEVTCR